MHYGPKIVRDGLVLHLDAANPKSYPGSGNTWYDLSGNKNDAVLVEATSNTAIFTGYDFEMNYTANGSYWEVPDDETLMPLNSWSVSGFLYVNGSQSVNGVGWFQKIGNSNERGIHIEPINNELRVNSMYSWSHPSFDISSFHNKFTNYTFTYNTEGTYGTDNGTLKVYINGNYYTETSTFIPALDNDGNNPIYLGRRNGHLRHYLIGKISNYMYFTRELTASEVKQNFEANRSRYGI